MFRVLALTLNYGFRIFATLEFIDDANYVAN